VSETTKDRSQEAVTTWVFRLIYRSGGKIPDTATNEELGRILRAARSDNTTLGITGR